MKRPQQHLFLLRRLKRCAKGSQILNKLRTLGLNTSLSNWILDYLTGHPQVVRVGNKTSATLLLPTGATQGCVLSPLLYYLFTHNCIARHDLNTINNW